MDHGFQITGHKFTNWMINSQKKPYYVNIKIAGDCNMFLYSEHSVLKRLTRVDFFQGVPFLTVRLYFTLDKVELQWTGKI